MSSAHDAVSTGPRPDSMLFERRRPHGKVAAEGARATDHWILAGSDFSPAAGEPSTCATEVSVS